MKLHARKLKYTIFWLNLQLNAKHIKYVYLSVSQLFDIVLYLILRSKPKNFVTYARCSTTLYFVEMSEEVQPTMQKSYQCLLIMLFVQICSNLFGVANVAIILMRCLIRSGMKSDIQFLKRRYIKIFKNTIDNLISNQACEVVK